MNVNEIRTHEQGVNVPTYDRIITSALGVGAIVFGVRERNPVGWAVAALGVVLAARGVSGRCALTRQIARRARPQWVEGYEPSGTMGSSAPTTGGDSQGERLAGLGTSISPQM